MATRLNKLGFNLTVRSTARGSRKAIKPKAIIIIIIIIKTNNNNHHATLKVFGSDKLALKYPKQKC